MPWFSSPSMGQLRSPFTQSTVGLSPSPQSSQQCINTHFAGFSPLLDFLLPGSPPKSNYLSSSSYLCIYFQEDPSEYVK